MIFVNKYKNNLIVNFKGVVLVVIKKYFIFSKNKNIVGGKFS